MNKFLDLLVLGLLVLFFVSIYRKRRTRRVLFWMVGWFCILLHFGSLIPHPQSPLGQTALQFCMLATLILCAICFIVSLGKFRDHPRRIWTVALLLGVPWIVSVGILSFSERGTFAFLAGATLGELGALVLALRYYWRERHICFPLVLSIFSCAAWLFWGVSHGNPAVAVDVILTQCFLMNAVLYHFEQRRVSAGAATVYLSMYAWAMVWPVASSLSSLAPHLVVSSEIWNLPKYFVAFGMILMLLEEEIFSAEQASQHYRLLFESNPHPMWMYDRETLAFLRVNDAAIQHYGYSREEFLKMSILDIRLSEDYEKLVEDLRTAQPTQLSGPWRHQKKDGNFVQVDIASHLFKHEGRNITFALMQDVTERQRLHDQLVHQANHDILTNLPNRALLEDRIGRALAHAARYEHKSALLCMDVDRFKQINDTYGHAAGDVCLNEIAQRLSARVRIVDTVARTGGEEFTILLHDITDASDAETVAADLLLSLKPPVNCDAIQIELAASIGIAIYPDDGTDAATLWRDADTAMYRAKQSGGNQFVSVSHEISMSALESNELEMSLRRALRDGGLELHYQPQFTMAGHLCGIEALVRLRHPTFGLVGPDRFIPIAEESGLIVPLGNWVVEEVCRQRVAWQQQGLHPVRVAFNVSPLQLTRYDFSSHILEVLARYDVTPGMLEMEVTESTVMRNIGHAGRQIETLAALGIHFSVDDFGTGYSSLGHLHQLPVQTLKIDRSFTARICEPNGTYPIVQAIISLAHSLGMQVVAEGVEREEQFERLHQLKCDRVQGFLFAPALPAAAVTKLMREHARSAEVKKTPELDINVSAQAVLTGT